MLTWNWTHFAAQAVVIFIFAFFSARRLKSGTGSWIYLGLAPFLLYYLGPLWLLALGLLLGYGLIFAGRRLSWLLPVVLLGLSTWQLKKGVSLEFPIHLINQLRGEHLPGILARLLHNKSELFYFWLKNAESQLSLTKLYAAANFKVLSPYFLMGLLYPWDIWFHLQAAKQWVSKPKISPTKLIFVLGTLFWVGLNPELFIARLGVISLAAWLLLVAASRIRRWPGAWLAAVVFTLWQFYLALNFIDAL